MANRNRRMVYRVNPAYLGKVKLQDGNSTHLLDDNTPQDVLKQLHTTGVLAQLYIDTVADESAAQIKDNGKAGQ